jgi:hypothetical protein
MQSLAEALRGADGGNKAPDGAEQISGAQASVHARRAVPSSGAIRRTDTGTLPIVALCPTGDGTTLARTLARVLVHRALIQDGAICAIDDCTNPMTSR